MRTAVVRRGLLGAALAVGATIAAQAALAGEAPVEPAAAGGDPMIGVVPQRDLSEGEVEMMREGGIQSVRMWLPWSSVESTRDEYAWGASDATVRALAEEGITALPFLFGSPGWAGQRDGYDCDGFGCITYPPASIETRYAFARFAGAAVRRYGPDGTFWAEHPPLPYRPIRAWQVWNEQNLEAFHRPDVDAPSYAEVLELAASEIRAADEDAKVLLGGMFGKHSNSRIVGAARYLRALYRVPGIEESFDGVAVHPYDPRARGVLDQIRAARKVIRAAGDNADLWITELGWASGGDRDQNLVKTRAGQARLLRRSFTQILRRARPWRLRGVYWYAWRDTETERDVTVCAWCPRAGLISRSGAPKPAFDALRSIANGR